MKLIVLTAFLIVFIALSEEKENEISQDLENQKFEKMANLLEKFSSKEKIDDVSNEEENIETVKFEKGRLSVTPDSMSVKWNGKVYYYSRDKSTYPIARKFCRNLWKAGNGDLVKINNQEENDFINREFVQKNRNKRIFIGANDLRKALDFHWSADNSEVTYTNWASGEPNNHNNRERCVEMMREGYWNDLKCHSELRFVCEHKPINQDHQTILWNGNEYYYSNNPLSFKVAKNFCRRFWGVGNGDLVKIDDKNENKFIHNEFFLKNGQVDLYIGANDIKQESDYRWTADHSEVKFTNWARGEPNHYGGQEKCVQMTRRRFWNDVDCETQSPFICEAKKSLRR